MEGEAGAPRGKTLRYTRIGGQSGPRTQTTSTEDRQGKRLVLLYSLGKKNVTKTVKRKRANGLETKLN